MRIYKNRQVERFTSKNGIDDASLASAIHEIEQGLVGANLGGGLLKQRVARRGGGKSGGFRTIIVFRAGQIAIFIHGFAKNDKDNLDATELKALRAAARQYLSLTQAELTKAVENGKLFRVISDEKTIP